MELGAYAVSVLDIHTGLSLPKAFVIVRARQADFHLRCFGSSLQKTFQAVKCPDSAFTVGIKNVPPITMNLCSELDCVRIPLEHQVIGKLKSIEYLAIRHRVRGSEWCKAGYCNLPKMGSAGHEVE